MTKRRRLASDLGVVLVSGFLHVVGFGVGSGADRMAPKPQMASRVSVVFATRALSPAPPPEPTKVPDVVPEEPDAPRARGKPLQRTSRRTDTTASGASSRAGTANAPSSPTSDLVDLTGTILTSEQDTSAAPRVPSSGSIATAGTRTTVSAAPVVGLDRLALRPVAPDLNGMLSTMYPASERTAGRTGEARVRIRVLPDGRVRVLGVLSATRPAFGEACRRVLERSRWTAPRDEGGTSVATDLAYRCQFELDR